MGSAGVNDIVKGLFVLAWASLNNLLRRCQVCYLGVDWVVHVVFVFSQVLHDVAGVETTGVVVVGAVQKENRVNY